MDWLGVSSALLGGLGGLFGGGDSGPDYQSMMFDKYNLILDEAMRIYNTTDLEAIDDRSLADYRKNVDKQVGETMSNYDARLGAAGYDPNFTDTEKTRTMGRIAKEGADSVASMDAELDRTRAGRKLAMLPQAGAVAGGFDMASRLDAHRQNQRFNEFQAMSQVAEGLLPFFFPKRKPAASGGAVGYDSPNLDLSQGNLDFLFSGRRGRL